MMSSSAFAVGRSDSEHGVRINLSSAAAREDLVAALRILAETLNDRPRALYDNACGTDVSQESILVEVDGAAMPAA